MTWGEENRWTSEVALSPGTYDFKLVIVRDEDGHVAAWESGENRCVTVSSRSLHSSLPRRGAEPILRQQDYASKPASSLMKCSSDCFL